MSGFDLATRLLSGQAGRKLFRSFMMGRATIFLLHRITRPEVQIRGHSIEFIKDAIMALRESGAEIVSLQTIVDAFRDGTGPAANWVAFTIDDGFADQGEIVASAFIPLKCPVTVFLITGFLDGALWPWDDQLSYAFRLTTMRAFQYRIGDEDRSWDISNPTKRLAVLRRLRSHLKSSHAHDLYDVVGRLGEKLEVSIPASPPIEYLPMTWQQIRMLEREGVQFAPHSVTHRIFARLEDSEVRTEIETSWRRLRQELANAVPIIAWPSGEADHFSIRDEILAAELGMLGSVATGDDYAVAGSQGEGSRRAQSLRRFSLPADLSHVLQYGSWIERAKQLMRRL